MKVSSNPFCYTKPVSPVNARVWVPEPNVPHIVDGLISRRCCLIVGPPASGTTSTLLAVHDAYSRKLPEAMWWYIDLNQMPTDDIASLFVALAADGASLFPEQDSRWSTVADDGAFRRALVESIASVRRPLVLAIDHIEGVPFPVAQAIVRDVRSLYLKRDQPAAPQRFISVVMAGSRRLRRQGEGRGSPLNFARVYYVQDLEPEVAVQMLLSAAEGQPWRFDMDAAKYLADETGGDKYLLQRIAYDCVASLAKNNEATIDLDLAQDVVLNFVEYGFRDDPKLGQLLPALVLDKDGLDIVLELARESDRLPLLQLLRADIAPQVSPILSQQEDFVTIRNNIYRRIISEHVPIFMAVRCSMGHARQELSRARRLQELTSLAELASTGREAMKSVLFEIREFACVKAVHLYVYDEALHQLVHSDSTTDHTLLFAGPVLAQDVLINSLQDAISCVRCQSVVEQCLPDECLGSKTGDCTWIALRERSASRLVGALALVDQPLVMSSQLNRELMELGATLAGSLQRQRHLAGLRLLSRIRVDLPNDEVQREICEVTRFLFNKSFAFLWLGDVNWLPLPLQAAVGVQQKRFADLGLTPNQALCQHLDDPAPRTLLVSPDCQSNEMIAPDVMSSIGLDHLRVAGFLMQDNQVGVLGVGAFDRWQPTDDEEIILAQLVAKQAPVILENIRAYHQTRRRLESSQLAVSLLPHELKRRPRAVGGELELLLSGKEGPIAPHQRKLLERAQEYMEEHERLIDTILDATRLDADVFQATMYVQPILPVLRNVLSRLATEIEGAGMQLVTDFAPVLPSHQLDPLLVDRIITNLVRNAVQYAGHGTVLVRAWSVDGRTLVEIQDEGPGVPPEFRERIFEQWHRGAFSQSIAGRPGNLGLGLYFVRKMMELHGGRAEYDDSYSGGACFRLTFPRLEGGDEDDSARRVDD